MDKFSISDLKKLNYSDVYHFIYANPHTSKQSIAVALQMSLPTVTQHLNSLLEQELIQKCGQLESQIGRKAIAYSIVSHAKIAIGVEILKERITITALDLYGQLLDTHSTNMSFSMTPQYYAAVCNEVLAFMDSLHVEPEQILGAGFGMQGLISPDGRFVTYGKVLNCTGLTIDHFQDHLNFPCRFVHDAECTALCELWEKPEILDAIYIALSRHLGGAIIVNGEISRGYSGKSGTIEHMTLVPEGLHCYCGQKGCFDCYCSADALLKDGESLDSFFQLKEEGDTDALQRWEQYLNYLALAINNLHMVLDSPVILGGHIAPHLKETDIAYLHKRARDITAFPEENTFIFQGSRNRYTISMGSALPYIKEYLSSI